MMDIRKGLALACAALGAACQQKGVAEAEQLCVVVEAPPHVIEAAHRSGQLWVDTTIEGLTEVCGWPDPLTYDAYVAEIGSALRPGDRVRWSADGGATWREVRGHD